jgi:hypothetical protein
MNVQQNRLLMVLFFRKIGLSIPLIMLFGGILNIGGLFLTGVLCCVSGLTRGFDPEAKNIFGVYSHALVLILLIDAIVVLAGLGWLVKRNGWRVTGRCLADPFEFAKKEVPVLFSGWNCENQEYIINAALFWSVPWLVGWGVVRGFFLIPRGLVFFGRLVVACGRAPARVVEWWNIQGESILAAHPEEVAELERQALQKSVEKSAKKPSPRRL